MSAHAGHSRAPAHQNTFAFKHNPNSRRTLKIAAIPNTGLCARCSDCIEWKKKYRKYKPLTQPRKCTGCQKMNVKQAYHVVCHDCASQRNVCAKCLEVRAIKGEESAEVRELREQIEMLSTHKGAIPGLSERERRSMLRQLQRETGGGGEDGPSGSGSASGAASSCSLCDCGGSPLQRGAAGVADEDGSEDDDDEAEEGGDEGGDGEGQDEEANGPSAEVPPCSCACHSAPAEAPPAVFVPPAAAARAEDKGVARGGDGELGGGFDAEIDMAQAVLRNALRDSRDKLARSEALQATTAPGRNAGGGGHDAPR